MRATGAVLSVGDPHRRVAGQAVLGAVVLAALFVACAWAAKEIPALYEHEPWQDDPYDVVVSFAIFFVPVLAALILMRVPLCKRLRPLPVRRVRDLLRASRAVTAVVAVTLASDWISVALGAHRRDWSAATPFTIAGLALVSAATLAVAVLLRNAGRTPRVEDTGPDWLADAVELGRAQAAQLGRMRVPAERIVSVADGRVLMPTRRHPLRAAGVVSLVFGASLAVTQGLHEGYAAAVLGLTLLVAAASMFAFLALVGAYLEITGGASQRGEVASGLHRLPARRRCGYALVAGSVSVPFVVAFRDALWSPLGINASHAATGTVLVLIAVIAAGCAVVTFAVATIKHR